MVSLVAEAKAHSSDSYRASLPSLEVKVGKDCHWNHQQKHILQILTGHPCHPWKWRLARIVIEIIRWLCCMFSKQVYVWMVWVGKDTHSPFYFAAHSQFISRQNSTRPCTVLQLITFPWLCLHLLTGPHSWCALCSSSSASHHMVSNNKIDWVLQAILAILYL